MGLTSDDVINEFPENTERTERASTLQPAVLPDPVFRLALIAVVVVAAGIVGYFGRRVFLWSDDYVFLFNAQGASLGWDQLKTPLFGHFSPVSQFTDVVVAANLPAHPWLIRAVLLVLSTGVVASVTFLMVSLFRRTWLALVGAAVAGPSLGLLPLVNWWTAGLNIMPAMIGVALTLGAVVRLVRGGSAWWGLVAVVGYLLAVFSWELGITAVGYAVVWTLLFRARVSGEPLSGVIRRTWWVWGALAVVAIWSVANYRLNYYNPTPAPPIGLALEALATSLLTIQLPLTLGFYDPSRAWFEILGIGLAGIAVVALVVITMLRSRRAWRGWSFALLGWLVPIAAVVLSRVGYIGVRAIEQPMYYYLPTMLFLVGVMEAWAAPWRPGSTGVASPAKHWLPRPIPLMAGAVTAAAVFLAYLSSAWPTISSTNYGMIGPPDSADRTYVSNLVDSAHALQATGQPFSVINGVAPASLLSFQGHNRLSQITSVHDPSIPFDSPDGPWYTPDVTGTLVPATITFSAEVLTLPVTPTDLPAGLTSSGVSVNDDANGAGYCFSVDEPGAWLRWDLPQPVAGGPLVVRTMATVDTPTPVRVSTVTQAGQDPVVANVNPRTWKPGQTGRLDTTPEPQIVAVTIDSLGVGASMCLSSLQVGSVGAA